MHISVYFYFRKQCTDHVSPENKQPQGVEEKVYRHRHKSKEPSLPLQCLANIVDPTHFYVDLASLQNTTHLPESNCQYSKLINAVMCVSNKRVPLNGQKHASPTSNIPVRYQLLNRPLNNIENVINKNCKKTTKLIDSEPTARFKKSAKKFPQVVLGHTSSPHHLRHRNRQEDQARAMAQVVRWLEQEFSSNVQCGDKKEKTKSSTWSNPEKQTGNNNSTFTSTESGVERHEHHHVHEHIHHHYHHYQETPIVV